jgi:TonB family protein
VRLTIKYLIQILFLFNLCFFAQTKSADSLICFSYLNEPLREVLNDICEQTNLMFVYSDNLVLNKNVNYNGSNISAEIALNNILNSNEIAHKYFGENSVVLYKKTESIKKVTPSPIKSKKELVEYKTLPSVLNLKLISDPTPKYPSEAIRKNIEGEIVIKIMVSENGEVKDAIIEKSSDSPILDEETLKFVYTLKFEPLKINDVARFSWTRLSYNYVLEDTIYNSK